jgi:hypothetical protein
LGKFDPLAVEAATRVTPLVRVLAGVSPDAP